ncbi:MAG: hypothetical protein IKV18_05120 [Alistipes sp.]|nr:hypothetical protein [Alistipes sp.]
MRECIYIHNYQRVAIFYWKYIVNTVVITKERSDCGNAAIKARAEYVYILCRAVAVKSRVAD